MKLFRRIAALTYSFLGGTCAGVVLDSISENLAGEAAVFTVLACLGLLFAWINIAELTAEEPS